MFIWGLFIWLVISNDLEVRAQPPEDTAVFNTKIQEENKVAVFISAWFFIPDEILFPFIGTRTSFTKYATLSVDTKGPNTNKSLGEREGKGDVAVN